MRGESSRQVVQRLDALFQYGVTGPLSDEDLLKRFITGSDELAAAAFATLVERHGPMVLGVCRRVLGNLHSAEDAFQATFLVLARKAAEITRREQLANWLYGVARCAALDARAALRAELPAKNGCASCKRPKDWTKSSSANFVRSWTTRSAVCPNVIGPRSSFVSSKGSHDEKPLVGSGFLKELSRADWREPRTVSENDSRGAGWLFRPAGFPWL